MTRDECYRYSWSCVCHSTTNPPWPSGDQPAQRCPMCDHPNLAVTDMEMWFASRAAFAAEIRP